MTLFIFNIASAIITTATVFRRWTSDVIQPSSLGSGPAAAIVKEFHTAQTTAARITATNIASITVLKVPQRSSCVDLQNCESLIAVRDCTRPYAPLKVLYGWSRAPRVITRLQALPHACTCQFSPADVSPRWRHLPRHLLTSSLTRPLTFPQGWLFQSRFFLPSFSHKFHFCSPFLHIVSLNG